MSEINMPPKKKKTINSDRSISEQHKNVSNTPKTSVDKSKPVKKQASTKPITGEQNAKFYTKPQPEATMQKLNKNENMLDKIKKLPIRQIRIGDTIKRGYVDKVNGCVYFMKDDGNLTGERAKIRKSANTPPKPAPQYKPTAPDKSLSVKDKAQTFKDKLKNFRDEKSKSSSKDSDKPKDTKSKSKKGMFAVIIAVGIIAVSIFTVKPLIANFKAPTVNNDTDAISVITLKQDVVPGDVITEDMLAQAKIDNKTYNQIAMNNTDIYKWDRCKDVIGLYATEYIPQEQYMSVNSVSSNFELKANPYGSSNSNFSYVDIPITEDLDKAKLLIGQKVNISFRIDSQSGKNQSNESQNQNGTTIKKDTSTATAEEYTISNAVIANILTDNDTDLYSEFAPLESIPEADLSHYIENKIKSNKEYVSSVTPAKIRIILERDYVDTIKKAISNKSEIKVELLETADTDNDEKKNFYNTEVNIVKSLYPVKDKEE